ncbi:hypothetical protein COCNU_06G009820 [Cocos nucifera]|uniref:Uncharacterized protein n=1 Tax=Cocos nucifera TaxID=13894 RepID=A0A8K0N2Q2_COCNU|nr:hypothetical protein COCNU_06G009820 [Cocos nucifera]
MMPSTTSTSPAMVISCRSQKVTSLAGGQVMVERIGSRNSVRITLKEMAEVSLNVVPVTKEDDRIHRYKIPSNDCFVHLEVQFKFFGLSPDVEGVLGRTYRPDYRNAAKLGVAMPVVGGEDEYRASPLLSPDCKRCLFSPNNDAKWQDVI